MEILFPTILLFFLIFASGFFSASETALFSLPTAKIKAYQSSSDPRKKLISSLVLQPRDLLVTVFMLNTLVNILLQNTISHMSGQSASWIFKVVAPFIILLLFGEVIPKYIGMKNNVSLSNMVAPSIKFFQDFLAPIRKVIISITTPVSHILFFFLHKEKEISKDELKHVLKTSQEHGVLHPDESELVWGYLNLQEAMVKELMRPRQDILYYNIEDPLSKLAHLFVEQECSRVPVCSGSIDNLLGIITAEQYFLNRRVLNSSDKLRKYLEKPYFIPETTPAMVLLRRFDELNHVIALVVDEYGTISGLIAREDLVEVVVGEISDLRDTKEQYTKAGVDEIITSGRLELSEFNEIFNMNLESEHGMITIGGWLVEQIGDIPKPGTKFEVQNLLFHVLAAEPNRIRRLYIRKLKENLAGKNHKTDSKAQK